MAHAGGYYTILEGDPLFADGSLSYDPDGDALTFVWFINGYPHTSLFPNQVNPRFNWYDLLTDGDPDGPGWWPMYVQVTDAAGFQSFASSAVIFENAPPTASIAAPPETVRGAPTAFVLSANDPSPVDQDAGFTFDIDWDGNGTVDESVSGPSGTTISHVFAENGSYNVRVTATDKDGGVSAMAAHDVLVVSWALKTDPNDGSKTNLLWGGTNGIDAYAFVPGLVLKLAENNQFYAFLLPNGQLVGQPQFTVVPSFNGKLIVYGQGGNDLILADVLNFALELYGGDGDDVIVGGRGSDLIDAGAGNDIVFGGTLATDGNDTIYGGLGDDLIIGHHGADVLYGGAGKDLIVASWLQFSSNIAGAAYSIQSEWTSNHSYAEKVANLTGAGDPSRLNGDTFLIPGDTVINDAEIDQVFGDDGQDLFLIDVGTDIALDVSELEDVLNIGI